MDEMNAMPHVRTLALCLQKMVKDGYVNDFSFTEGGLMVHQTRKLYKPAEIKVINTMKFEVSADADDNAILYTLETTDGVKGTLVDAFGIYGDKDSAVSAVLSGRCLNAPANKP